MSNAATEQMLLFVQKTKESADRAEQEYDRKADQLQMKAGRGIDLFGGNAVSQVADIASTSRKICDELYAAYQMLIKMLDEDCRPLLAQQPEYRAVRAVRDLIQKLNNESEIENNFTASLNDRSLGGVASGRYIPSIECKMIESFWATKCASWPGREEAEERARRVDDLIRQRDENTKKSNQERIDQYYNERKQWQTECERIRTRRTAEVNRRVQEVQSRLQQTAKEKYEKACKLHGETADQYKKAITDAEAALGSLGFFKFAERKEQKAIINDAMAKIEQANARIKAAKDLYDSEAADAVQKAQGQKAAITEQVEKEYPLPARPALPRIDGITNQNDFYKKALLEGMERDRLYTPAELIENIPELAELTPQRVSAYLRQLVEDFQVERVEEKRKAFFRLY